MVEIIHPYCRHADCQHKADLILCMTVDPGFGGQSFIASTLPKVERLRSRITQHKIGHSQAAAAGIAALRAAIG